MAFFVVFFKSC